MGKPKVEILPAPDYPLDAGTDGKFLRPFDFWPKQAPEKPLPRQAKMESTAKILVILLLKIQDESYSKKLPAATWNEVEKVSELKVQVLPLQTKCAASTRAEVVI